MRMLVVLGAGASLMTAGAATAQGAPYPRPAPHTGTHVGQSVRTPMPQAPRIERGAPVMHRQGRWGSHVGGRWWGGANAPGGWAAYRQPFRGYRVPMYWVAPRFYVTDWARHGLYAPTGGHSWVRYYDDAILIDRSGNVSDWRGGLDWNAYDRGGDTQVYMERREGHGGTVRHDADRGHDRRGPPPGYREAPVEPLPPPNRMEWRGDGPPPSHVLPRGERRVVIVRRDRGAGYPPPPPHGGHHGGHHGGPGWTQDGHGSVTTTRHHGGAPIIVTSPYGGTTTVTIHGGGSVTTTTTTETIEDVVTYTRPAVRRTVRARTWHARPRVKTKTRPR